MSLDQLEYERESGTVTYTSAKADGPTAGRHTFYALEFIARLVAHIPDKGKVMQRDLREPDAGQRQKTDEARSAPSVAGDVPASDIEPPEGSVTILEPEGFSRGDARRRWAELIPLVYEVDPMVCPRCGGEMRVIALIHESPAIDRILRHLRNKGRDPRGGPWATGPPGLTATDEPA